MPCNKPIEAYRSYEKNSNGKHYMVFNPVKSYNHVMGIPIESIWLPCGRCIGCRLERSRQWAIRCEHEASMHDQNSFLTLTYNDKHLPDNESLVLEDFQKFMKRLRKHIKDKVDDRTIKYFHCGEYGELKGRPHYHAIIFGFEFSDTRFLRRSKSGYDLYTSDTLDSLWKKGYCQIGEVTFDSCAYVARYITKKLGYGDKPEWQKKYIEKYGLDLQTGEILKKEEYITMSRREGIGKGWFEKYHSDIYPEGILNRKGFECKPPKYYDDKFEILDPKEYEKLKKRRKNQIEDLTEQERRTKVKSIGKINQGRLENKPRAFENTM